MTFKPERLTPRNLHRLSAITPTAGAPWWAADVENFLAVRAPNQVLAKTGSGLLHLGFLVFGIVVVALQRSPLMLPPVSMAGIDPTLEQNSV